jgi:hypothetical protein
MKFIYIPQRLKKEKIKTHITKIISVYSKRTKAKQHLARPFVFCQVRVPKLRAELVGKELRNCVNKSYEHRCFNPAYWN